MSRPNAGPSWLGVVGRPIAHSLSPVLHEAGLASLERSGGSFALDVGPATLPHALEWLHEIGLAGLNVTAPHKEAALRLAVAATEEARAAGSANVLRPLARSYEATNTDGEGLVAFLEEAAVPLGGQAAVLLGGGGAAAGLAPALRERGAGVSVVAREPAKISRFAGLAGVPAVPWGSPEAARLLAQADLVVQATPLGREPGDPLPCAPNDLRPDAVAVDLLYAPSPTPWLTALRASGRRAHDGLGLLVWQCALSFRFWFSETPPITSLREAVSCPPPDRS